MATTLAKYFTEELTDWERTIAFYSEEISGLILKLHEVISRNSIPNIAEKVEIQQAALDRVTEKFYILEEAFNKQKPLLITDSTFIDDSVMSSQVESEQHELREKMRQAEKDCVEAMNNCRLFLSEIFKGKGDA